ncbi:MAG: NAD(P)H-binding protein [Pseudomonadota bacterium]
MFRIACLLHVLIAVVSLGLTGHAGASGHTSGGEADSPRVLIYGASGRIGSKIVDEALLRGYRVSAVTRDASRLDAYKDRVEVIVSDILDPDATRELLAQFDSVIVSIGGTPTDSDPAKYIAARAADSLIDVLTPMGTDGPRLIFVGNLFTLIYADGKTLLELGRVAADNPNRAMFEGHQIALDAFRASDINWTVATPPNGLRLEGRTGAVRWGGDELLRDEDGASSQISREDFAYAVLEELEHARYIRARFNVAR